MTITVMPIGDSLTVGWAPKMAPRLASFDAHTIGRVGGHEGHAGWGAAALANELPAAMKAVGVPDMLVIAWGTNDAAGPAQRVLDITSKAMALAWSRGVRGIVLVPPPPITRAQLLPGAATFVRAVADGYGAMASAAAQNGQNVGVVEVMEAPPVPDGVHFAPDAYDRIAARVANAVQIVASRMSPATSSPLGALLIAFIVWRIFA